jgi:hypothetical protein
VENLKWNFGKSMRKMVGTLLKLFYRKRVHECGLDSSGSGDEKVAGFSENIIMNLQVP